MPSDRYGKPIFRDERFSPPPWVEALIGPTGRRIAGDHVSDGELCLAVGQKDGHVMMHFGTTVVALGLNPEQARAIAESLIRTACEIDGKPFELKIGG